MDFFAKLINRPKSFISTGNSENMETNPPEPTMTSEVESSVGVIEKEEDVFKDLQFSSKEDSSIIQLSTGIVVEGSSPSVVPLLATESSSILDNSSNLKNKFATKKSEEIHQNPKVPTSIEDIKTEDDFKNLQFTPKEDTTIIQFSSRIVQQSFPIMSLLSDNESPGILDDNSNLSMEFRTKNTEKVHPIPKEPTSDEPIKTEKDIFKDFQFTSKEDCSTIQLSPAIVKEEHSPAVLLVSSEKESSGFLDNNSNSSQKFLAKNTDEVHQIPTVPTTLVENAKTEKDGFKDLQFPSDEDFSKAQLTPTIVKEEQSPVVSSISDKDSPSINVDNSSNLSVEFPTQNTEEVHQIVTEPSSVEDMQTEKTIPEDLQFAPKEDSPTIQLSPAIVEEEHCPAVLSVSSEKESSGFLDNNSNSSQKFLAKNTDEVHQIPTVPTTLVENAKTEKDGFKDLQFPSDEDFSKAQLTPTIVKEEQSPVVSSISDKDSPSINVDNSSNLSVEFPTQNTEEVHQIVTEPSSVEDMQTEKTIPKDLQFTPKEDSPSIQLSPAIVEEEHSPAVLSVSLEKESSGLLDNSLNSSQDFLAKKNTEEVHQILIVPTTLVDNAKTEKDGFKDLQFTSEEDFSKVQLAPTIVKEEQSPTVSSISDKDSPSINVDNSSNLSMEFRTKNTEEVHQIVTEPSPIEDTKTEKDVFKDSQFTPKEDSSKTQLSPDIVVEECFSPTVLLLSDKKSPVVLDNNSDSTSKEFTTNNSGIHQAVTEEIEKGSYPDNETPPGGKKTVRKSCSSPISPNSKENNNKNKNQQEEKSQNSEQQRKSGKLECSLDESCVNTDSNQLSSQVNKHVEGTETLVKKNEVPSSDQKKLTSLPDIVNVLPKSINSSVVEDKLNDTASLLVIDFNKLRLSSNSSNDTQYLKEPLCAHEGVSSDEETFLECQTPHSSQISLNNTAQELHENNGSNTVLKSQNNDDASQNKELLHDSVLSPQPTTMLENIKDTKSPDNISSFLLSHSTAKNTNINDSIELRNENEEKNVENKDCSFTALEAYFKEKSDSPRCSSRSSDLDEKEKPESKKKSTVDATISVDNINGKSFVRNANDAADSSWEILQSIFGKKQITPGENISSNKESEKETQQNSADVVSSPQSNANDINAMHCLTNSLNAEQQNPKNDTNLLSISNHNDNGMSQKLEDDRNIAQSVVKSNSDVLQSQECNFVVVTADKESCHVSEIENDQTFIANSCTPMDVDYSSFIEEKHMKQDSSTSLGNPLDVLRDFFEDGSSHCCHCLLVRLGLTLCKNRKTEVFGIGDNNKSEDEAKKQNGDGKQKEHNEGDGNVEVKVEINYEDPQGAMFGYGSNCAPCSKMLRDFSPYKEYKDKREIVGGGVLRPETEPKVKRSYHLYTGSLKRIEEIQKIIFTGVGLDSLPLTDDNWIFSRIDQITEGNEQIRKTFLLNLLSNFDDAILKAKSKIKQKDPANDPKENSPLQKKEQKQQNSLTNCISTTITEESPITLNAPDELSPLLAAEDELFFLESRQKVKSSIFNLGTDVSPIGTEAENQIDSTAAKSKSNAKMSADVIKDMNINEDIKSLDIKSDDKKTNNMNEMEKEMKIENVKTEEVERKLKEAEQKEEELLKRITLKDKTIIKMSHVIEAYEKAIAELIAEKEQAFQNYEKHLEEVKAERDLNYQHLTSLESTFTDLHAKYERSKQITTKLKASEEELKAERAQCLENLRLQEVRYEKMKNHAMQQLELANDKFERLTNAHGLEVARLTALLKKEQVGRQAVSDKYEQKCRENEELMKICDELINGHTGGSSSSS